MVSYYAKIIIEYPNYIILKLPNNISLYVNRFNTFTFVYLYPIGTKTLTVRRFTLLLLAAWIF